MLQPGGCYSLGVGCNMAWGWFALGRGLSALARGLGVTALRPSCDLNTPFGLRPSCQLNTPVSVRLSYELNTPVGIRPSCANLQYTPLPFSINGTAEMNSFFPFYWGPQRQRSKRSPTDIAPSVLLPLAVWFITKTPNKKKQKPPNKRYQKLRRIR